MRVRNLSPGRGFFPVSMSLPMPVFAPDGGGALDAKQLEKDLSDLTGKITTLTTQLSKDRETLAAEMKNLGDGTKETKTRIDQALTDFNAAKATLDDVKGRLEGVEGVVSRIRQGGAPAMPKTVGQQFVESEAWKNFQQNRGQGRRVVVEVAQMITSLTTDATGSVGAAIMADRQAGVLEPARRRMTIRALLMPGNTVSNAIEYVQEKGFTNNASIQAAEGDLKLESSIQFELKNAFVRTIAHWMLASVQVLDDVPMLQSYIDGKLRYGLQLAEEAQLLMGSGQGVNLHGIYTEATAYAPSFTPANPTMIDTLRLAMLQCVLAEWPATGHVLNPIDWARIELTKDQENRYLFANPQAIAGPTLWSLPVVETQAMPADKFLTGAFRPAAQIFDRMNPTVAVSTEDSDNFRRNLVTIRAEERLTVVVYRPEALVKGDFGNES